MNEISRRRFLAATGICAGSLPMLEQWLAAATVSGTTDTYTPPLNGPGDRVVSLAGNWALQLDAEDAGLEQQWFLRSLPDRIQLPGSLDERGKGSPNEKRETGAEPGGRVPPPGWPCGVRWPEDASGNEPILRLARELHVRRALVTATGNAAEGIPRGNIRGRDPLAGGTRTGCSITPRTSHVPAGQAARGKRPKIDPLSIRR
jgi:hypothetical protein